MTIQKKTPMCVYADGEFFWYSADEIELVQELSAVEVINILHEICYKHGFLCEGECVLSNHCPLVDAGKNEFNSQKVYAICEQWKADHEKKEPEFEWVDICRIIEVQDNGKKVCVHEEDIKDADLPFGYKECTAEMILKKYMKSHRGSYFATVEHVCRVKR